MTFIQSSSGGIINRRFLLWLAALLLMTAVPLPTAAAADDALYPTALKTTIGKTSPQPLSVLAVADQSGNDNDPTRYKTFDAAARGYSGLLTFNLPAGQRVATLTQLRLETTYRGPAAAAQRWLWELRDHKRGRWVLVGTNDAAAAGVWTALSFEVPGNPADYLNKGKIQLRYRAPKGTSDSHLDYLALVAITPPPPTDIWRPAPGTTWQWQLQGTINTGYDVDMYDIDLFDTPASLIDQLHADGRVVICYISAGSWENWRPDASRFPAVVKGKSNGWAGERWLDIRRIDKLGPIMKDRLDLAVAKGCDGIEPDNIDGYTNNTGFPLTYAHQLAYNRWLAAEAHARGLSIGLKNDLDQVADLVDHYDWAINEQCWQYNECHLLDPFVAAGKAVFGVEYQGNPTSFCPALNGRGFSWLKLPLALDDSSRIDCLADYR